MWDTQNSEIRYACRPICKRHFIISILKSRKSYITQLRHALLEKVKTHFFWSNAWNYFRLMYCSNNNYIFALYLEYAI